MVLDRTRKELLYSFYVIFHPFKGFWDIKHEKEGSLNTAMVILGFFILVTGLAPYFTEWLYNSSRDPLRYNAVWTMAGYTAAFFMFCVSNWCFTCLSDGEGTFKDICVNTAYSLVPFILIKFVQILLSHILVLAELPLYTLLSGLAMVWTGGLVVFGLLVAHQYTLAKTLVVCAATLVGMIAMAYIGVLFFSLIQQLLAFFTILAGEIRLIYGR
ncbi:hypothetical protein FACS1894141_5070 [Spirochaetia bacterium]|nr:hypothetical protein FACS1894141_5070 [Spirochaetia bacterium]